MLRSVQDIMQSKVFTVTPSTTLAELERAFFDKKVSGFPVVDGSRLVGIVTRSDVVRQLSVERSLAEMSSASGLAPEFSHQDALGAVEEIAERVGKRVAAMTVKDCMIKSVISLSPEQEISQAAALFVERHIHRAPVTKDGKLVGIVTSTDLIRLLTRTA